MNSTVCSDKFPAGLRVLAVDDDPTCLLILEKMLQNCLYQVTKCSSADVALSILRENRDGFDVVISDVHMPDMDGFKLLEHVGLEMDLPVIMMSADDSSKVVLKGVTHGACDYLIKPVRMEALKNIWQHVVRKKKHEWREKEEEDNREQLSNSNLNTSDEADNSSSANEGSSGKSSSKKRKVKDDDEKEDTSASKKPRVIWTAELHKQFLCAVKLIGLDKAVPKKILEVMNVPWITRENVASHLQKYRLYMRKVKIEHCKNGCRIPLMGPTDPNTTPNVPDFQNIASSSQLQLQSRTTIQTAWTLNNRAATSWAPIDQSNLFTFGNQRHQLNNSMQLNLLHGIPVNANLLPWNQALQPMIPNMGLGWNGVDTLRAQPFASSSHPPPFVGISGSRPSDNNAFPLISNKNGGPTFDATRHATSMQARVDVVVPSALVQTGYSTEQRSVQHITTAPSVNNTNLGQQLPSSTAENSSPKNNPDGLADMGFGCGSPFSDLFGQDDLPSPFFKQPEEGLIQGESVFGADELIPLG